MTQVRGTPHAAVEDVGEEAPGLAMGARRRPVASRVVDDGRVVEEALFFGSADAPIFGVMHRPPAEAIGGVLICSPTHAELLRNYRREVLLGRELARNGIAVQRFQYAGSGHSADPSSSQTFEHMLDDARQAFDRLSEIGQLAVMGTRLGATVAAALAAESDVPALVMWEPVTDPGRYFREVFRGRLVSQVKRGEETSRSRAIEELHRSGGTDVLGYEVGRPFYETILARGARDFDQVPPDVLLVQIGGPPGLRTDYRELVEKWKSDDSTVDTYRLEGAEPWWFGTAPETVGDDPDRASELVEVTSRWLIRNLA